MRYSENDVDTAIHLLLGANREDSIFEGMCNPPGGDWSGISLVVPNEEVELRWLSLPRVSGVKSKRPDHVFEFLKNVSSPIVLSIESKEKRADVEKNIGVRLNRYITELISTTASVERGLIQGEWRHSRRSLKHLPSSSFVSAAAFLANSEAELKEVANNCGCDVIIGVNFTAIENKCRIMDKKSLFWRYGHTPVETALKHL